MSEDLSQSKNNPDSAKSWEERDPDIEREITIDEFQPYGTLTLTLIYFAIVVLMWIFMYFVEFAGNAPSIIE
ncbi:hypothetical protein [Fodinibius sp.]|uniref:hypothetical protein n=1 Tax=Fodinibius sp. TaxID=1872440 RepID=UPI002ACD4372|nr:hypothetical protein [Fodinibius sp.]MDZ7659596.1 hypothetical protein [Fodinibius sp.]